MSKVLHSYILRIIKEEEEKHPDAFVEISTAEKTRNELQVGKTTSEKQRKAS